VKEKHMFRHYRSLLGMVAASILLAIPAAAASSAIPGTLNYVEGQAAVAGQTVTPRDVGSVQVQPNQVLETGQGRAELLLTPGVFLRIGENSAVRLVSPGLADTRVEVLRGQAIIEVAELFKDNNLSVTMNGASTRLEKQGLYSFNANSRLVQVFNGEARVQQNDRQKNLTKDHEMALDGAWKVTHFDVKWQAAQDPLYGWSNLRSEYEAEASMQSARNIFVGGGAYWDGPGWYWNPYWAMYGFIPGDGIWYSPFGWPFYSPWVAYRYGFGYGYGRGFAARPFAALQGHGHVSGSTVASGGFAGSARVGGGFGARGFAGGMHGGFAGGGGRR
jgi:FecR protein